MHSRFSRRVFLASAAAVAQASRAAESEIRLPGRLRLGIYGTEGHVGDITGPLKRLPDVEFVAVAGNGAQGLAKRFPGTKVYPSLDAMLGAEKLDVAAVTNDNGGRAAAIMACAERGVNVIAEKPFAINRRDLERVRETAARKKIALGTILPMRFEPHYRAMHNLMKEGTLGEIVQVAGQKSYKAAAGTQWRLHRETYGSTILWIGIHMIDLMLFTTGRDIRETAGWQTRVGMPELQDQENVSVSMFRFDNGALGELRMDYLRSAKAATHGDDRLRIAGTRGIVEWDHDRGLVLMTSERAPARVIDLPPQGSVFIDFLEHVYNGKPSMLPERDIWRSNEVTMAAHEAAVLGRFVKA
ncbi:MAG TPA: Gfo/Idh/MocA family oxidoreductase [Bryobacteraceae bacterium]|nr:Gfo/Idh/MocA family oxidoreductase [Bryobacteraceae bacterium]